MLGGGLRSPSAFLVWTSTGSLKEFSEKFLRFYVRKQLCFQRVLGLAIAIQYVRQSVCHTGGSGKNG